MIFKKPPDDDESQYEGNIFGWRVSLIGLLVLLALAALVVYRTRSLNVPVGFEDPLKMEDRRGYYQEKAAREKAAEDSLLRERRRLRLDTIKR